MSIVAAIKACRRVTGASWANGSVAREWRWGGRQQDRHAVPWWATGHRCRRRPRCRLRIARRGGQRCAKKSQHAVRRPGLEGSRAAGDVKIRLLIRSPLPGNAQKTDEPMLGGECRDCFPCVANVVLACIRPGGGDVLIHLPFARPARQSADHGRCGRAGALAASSAADFGRDRRSRPCRPDSGLPQGFRAACPALSAGRGCACRWR
ncbi:hypothetical protein EV667_0721 [Ancylobacter aquaticus]|uniref:Uncharacterized protein n=1 Tax=Ancylobacter aquaticus TaxID=100 RepID=A0A4V2PK12_ANCAQ|nr:hypothetical protein EV667_0721 [Ancylobacter aquaticus]